MALIAAVRDSDSDPPSPRKGANLAATVALVTCDALGPQLRSTRARAFDCPLAEQRLEHRGIVLLARRQGQGEQLAVALGADMHFRAETASAAA